MAFEKVSWIWKKRTYFLIWLVTTLVVGWVYIGPLTDQEAYDVLLRVNSAKSLRTSSVKDLWQNDPLPVLPDSCQFSGKLL